MVAIVGDGAIAAGMAFEAMNDAVAHNADMMVVLNDNDMSISQSTGGFAKHLASIWEQGQFVNIDAHGQAFVQIVLSGITFRVCMNLQLMLPIIYLKRLVLIISVHLMDMMSSN